MTSTDFHNAQHTKSTEAQLLIYKLLKALKSQKGSDLFVTSDFAPAIKINGLMTKISSQSFTAHQTAELAHAIMTPKQREEFEQTKECNFAYQVSDLGRFRVNAFIQQSKVGMVFRTIAEVIPTVDELGLPQILKDLSMRARGLCIIVGATGAGKSTTLASMLDWRNQNSQGHIITVEDPIEFVHRHGQSIVTQREIGMDTADWHIALKNALRQAPDVVLMGEIRDRVTMEHAITFAETGHLCLATLHASNANQALDRIINFFPDDRRKQLLLDLSLNLTAMVSQRLIRKEDDSGRAALFEIMLNSPLIADLIAKGEVLEIKEIMKKSRNLGMQTFDQALFDAYEAGHISQEDALRQADSSNDLRLAIKLTSERAKRDGLPLETHRLKVL